MPLTEQQIADGVADLNALGLIVGGAANVNGNGEVPTRLGASVKTLARVIADLLNTDVDGILATGIDQRLDVVEAIGRTDWLAPDVLPLSGAAIDRWNYADRRFEVAKMIKAIWLPNADPARRYAITVFCHDDPTYSDNFIISDDLGGIYWQFIGDLTSKSVTDVTKIDHVYNNRRAVIWVDYRNVAPGLLMQSTYAQSPLKIARTSTQSLTLPEIERLAKVRDLLARNQISLYRNVITNPTFDPAGPTVAFPTGTLVYNAAGATLAAKGIKRTISINTALTTTIFKQDTVSSAEAAANAFLRATAYVEAPDAAGPWPASLGVYPYRTGEANISAIVNGNNGYTQITPTVRLYWTTGQLPNFNDIDRVRMGFPNTVAGDVRTGGFNLVFDTAAIDSTMFSPDIFTNSRVDAATLATAIAGLNGITPLQTAVSRAQLSPYGNRAANPTLDPTLAAANFPVIGGGAINYLAPATAELAAKGVKRVIDMNSATNGAARYKVEPIPAASSGLYCYASAYVESPSGLWPANYEIYSYYNPPFTQVNLASTTFGYTEITPTLRRYWIHGRLAIRNDFAEVRHGFTTKAGDVRMGGFQFIMDAAPIDRTLINNDLWFNVILSTPTFGAVEQRLAAVEAIANPVTGAIVAAFGDSITESYGVPSSVQGYLPGITVHNFGFGGGRLSTYASGAAPGVHLEQMTMVKIADAINTGDWTAMIQAGEDLFAYNGDDNRPQIAAMAALNWQTVTHCYINFGTNDWSGGRPLGVAADATSATIMGALNYVITTLQTKCPNMQIGIVTPHWRGANAALGDSDVNPNSQGSYLYQWADAYIDRAKAHHLPFLDLYRESGVNKFNKATFLSDDLHPSIPAGRNRMAKKIATFLRTKF